MLRSWLRPCTRLPSQVKYDVYICLWCLQCRGRGPRAVSANMQHMQHMEHGMSHLWGKVHKTSINYAHLTLTSTCQLGFWSKPSDKRTESSCCYESNKTSRRVSTKHSLHTETWTSAQRVGMLTSTWITFKHKIDITVRNSMKVVVFIMFCLHTG